MTLNKAHTPTIRHLDADQEYYFKEGCYILELWNAAEDPACSVARARVSPGRQTLLHSLHGITERYVIQTGEGRVQVGNVSENVRPGSVVVIPPECPQRILNIGEEDLVFLAICTPRFEQACYQALEN